MAREQSRRVPDGAIRVIRFYAHVLERAAEIPGAVVAAETWISRGGFDPKRFSWECQPVGRGLYQLFASCTVEDPAF